MFRILFFLLSLCGFIYSAPNGLMTNPRQFPQGYTGGALFDVICTYNLKNNTVFLSWGDTTPSQNPYFAIYNCSSNTFTTLPTLIDANYTQGVYADVICSYNSRDNTVFLSWSDYVNNDGIPYFAIYDCSSNTFTTPPTLVNANYTAGVFTDIIPSYNSRDNTVFLSWASYPALNPYFAIYNCSLNTFSTPPTLIDPNYLRGVTRNVDNSYNSEIIPYSFLGGMQIIQLTILSSLSMIATQIVFPLL